MPIDLNSWSSYSDHRLHEVRSLVLHTLVVQKIEKFPELLDIAHNNLESWLNHRTATGEQPDYLEEWREILRQPWIRIAAVLTEQSERSVRLRSTSPFSGVLTQEERARVFDLLKCESDSPSNRSLDDLREEMRAVAMGEREPSPVRPKNLSVMGVAESRRFEGQEALPTELLSLPDIQTMSAADMRVLKEQAQARDHDLIARGAIPPEAAFLVRPEVLKGARIEYPEGSLCDPPVKDLPSLVQFRRLVGADGTPAANLTRNERDAPEPDDVTNLHADELSNEMADALSFQARVAKQHDAADIGLEMHSAGLPERVISRAVELSAESEAILQLMQMWSGEEEPEKRSAIVADIQELIDDSSL